MSREDIASQFAYNDVTDINHDHVPDALAESSRKPYAVVTKDDSVTARQAVSIPPAVEAGGHREVACQTDYIGDLALLIALPGSTGRLENRSTQTEPATRSVFTRSSRFLPDPNDNRDERQYSAASASPSHQGDSTAVLSSGRGRGRFRGRGHNRVRLRRAVSLPNLNASNVSAQANHQNQVESAGRLTAGRSASFFTSGGASTPNDILALLEARLGETPLQSSSTRSLQDPPGPPPVSPTEATPVTSSQGTSATADNVLSVKVVARDVDSLSTSDNLTILAPKSGPTPPAKQTIVAFGAKWQQYRDLSTGTTEIDSTSDRPPRVVRNQSESTALRSSPSLRAGSSWGSAQAGSTATTNTSLLMGFDGLNIVDSPEVRNRRRGVRGFLSRLLGKDGSGGQKAPGARNSSTQAETSNRTLGSFNGRHRTATAAGSNSDSTG